MKLQGKICQYGACGRTFSATSVFDKHRTGPFTHNVLTRECMTDEQLLAKGMYQDAKGRWHGSKWVRNADSPIACASGYGDRQNPVGEGGYELRP